MFANHLPAGTVAIKVAAAQQLEVHGRSWLRLFLSDRAPEVAAR
jgi:hypothetical protein